MSVIKYLSDRASQPISLLTTELNSLANAAGAIATTAVDNDAGLDLYVDIEVLCTLGATPTADAPIEVYFVRTVDAGTNYEDNTTGASGIPPKAGYVGSVFVRAVTTAQRMILPMVKCPPQDFKVYILNRAGTAMAATGNTVRGHFYKLQVV